jgi:3-methyladenine DNA glycosylase AlkD
LSYLLNPYFISPIWYYKKDKIMNLQEAMRRLEEAGTEQNQKIYRRHGIKGEMFGVSYANLGKLAKEIKKDHQLARQLWQTDVHDAQVLATMIADAKQLTSEELDDWAGDLSDYVLTDAFAKLAAGTSWAREKAEKWRDSENEWIASAGWSLTNSLTGDKGLPDEYFERLLEKIEREIRSRPNRVRYVMNGALIGIGVRNENLQKKALATAKKIGKVEVDHGETGCQTPDAAEYILKTVEHRKKKAKV